MTEIYKSEYGQVYQGDCLEIMKTLPENSIETCITDTPAGISFMQKSWDSSKGGRDKWIAWARERFSEVFRILKPGGFALVWALPRTAHWPATALEDAGFQIMNKNYFLFGGGWPKGLDISKGIDKHFGCIREKIEMQNHPKIRNVANFGTNKNPQTHEEPVPVHPQAQQWNGWNSQLKPMCEEWIVAMKPTEKVYWHELRELTGLIHWIIQVDLDTQKKKEKYGVPPEVQNAILYQCKPLVEGDPFFDQIFIDGKAAGDPFNVRPFRPWHSSGIIENALKWGTGGFNIDECRLPLNDEKPPTGSGKCNYFGKKGDGGNVTPQKGRYPGNVIIDDEVAAVLDERYGERKSGKLNPGKRKEKQGEVYGMPVGEQKGHELSTGGASRFFTRCNFEETDFYFSGKACQAEKNIGCEKFKNQTFHPATRGKLKDHNGDEKIRKNIHPTVKSIQLMRWLCKLSKTPTGGTIIDPFAGTFTTLIAAFLEGRKFIGIEQEPEYCEIGLSRLKGAMGLFYNQKNGGKK